ncbi:MAG TPA: CheR family methyltransferase [Blastocatellia bacterium]|nr:CheR family methyltransferase [Blastocatellia bacterium]
MPDRYLKRFMLRGKRAQEGKVKAGPQIRSVTRFQRLNLNDNSYPIAGKFGLLFCRNVMIYFNAESKVRTVDNLLDYVSPSGHLFLGHAETLNGLTDRVRPVIPTVYSPVTGGSPAAARFPAPLDNRNTSF